MFGFSRKSVSQTDADFTRPASPDVASAGEPPADAAAPVKRSWAERLKSGLARTRQQLGGGLANLFGRRKIDEDLL
ncbi:MAG: signal recognition particle-docking protein FtsY, partial [Azoarcus sp.]|nr:signal recognition particle-docking protein FtsY [Azoarcus sp.]